MKRKQPVPPKRKLPKKVEESASESYESEEESHSRISVEQEDTDIDEHRLKLAKRMIANAKQSMAEANGSKKLKDAYLIGVDEDEDEEDGEVERDETDQLTGFLQNKLQMKNKKLQIKLYDAIYKEYLTQQNSFKQLVLKAHTRPITACCFNPRNHDLVSVAKDGSIVLFDHDSGFKRRLLSPGYPKSADGHSDEILCLDISWDGKYLITAGKDRVIKVWNLGLYSKELAEMKQEIAQGDFAVITHGKVIPVSHNKHMAERRNSIDSLSVKSGKSKEKVRSDSHEHLPNGKGKSEIAKALTKHPELQLITTLKGHKEGINSLKFRFNSYECVSGSTDKSMKTWDVSQNGMLETFYGHRAEMTDLSIMTDNNVVSVGFDKVPIIWKLDKETQMIYDEQPFSLDCVFVQDPHFFFTGSQDGGLCLWNVGKKKPLQRYSEFVQGGWISSLTGLYNGDFLVAGGRESPVRIYKVEIRGPKDYVVKETMQIQTEGVVCGMNISSDGKWLAVIESPENRLGRWTVEKSVRPKIKLIKLFSDKQ
jgi:WD40 repeat protein